MNTNQNRVCPVKRAGSLDNVLRRWLQNPLKILAPYIQEGMTVLDVGCGPGFFTIPMAQMVGSTGRVIAVDLQDGMLEKVRCKISETEIENRIALHKCEEDSIGVVEQVDFILLFYIVHEIPNQANFFTQIAQILRATGQVLIVEPAFHVSKAAFGKTLEHAKIAGLKTSQSPSVILSKTAILQKGPQNLEDDA